MRLSLQPPVEINTVAPKRAAPVLSWKNVFMITSLIFEGLSLGRALVAPAPCIPHPLPRQRSARGMPTAVESERALAVQRPKYTLANHYEAKWATFIRNANLCAHTCTCSGRSFTSHLHRNETDLFAEEETMTSRHASYPSTVRLGTTSSNDSARGGAYNRYHPPATRGLAQFVGRFGRGRERHKLWAGR